VSMMAVTDGQEQRRKKLHEGGDRGRGGEVAASILKTTQNVN
jgi:hypothetical protein